MTICISVRVAEGLVMAADSTTVLQGNIQTPEGVKEGVLQVFDYATKVAQVGDLPMGVMTWGVGSLESRSIQSLVMEFEFEHRVDGAFRVKSVADDLLRFIAARYDRAVSPRNTPADAGPVRRRLLRWRVLQLAILD